MNNYPIEKVEINLKDLSAQTMATANVTFRLLGNFPLSVKNFRVCKSKYSDLWIQPPSLRHPGNKKFMKIVYADDKELWKLIEDAIIAEYTRIRDEQEKKEMLSGINSSL